MELSSVIWTIASPSAVRYTMMKMNLCPKVSFQGLAYIQTNQFIHKCALHTLRKIICITVNYTVTIQDWWHIPGWTLFYLHTVIEVSPHLSSSFSFVISLSFFVCFFPSHCSLLGNHFNASVATVQWAPIHWVLTHSPVVSICVVSLLFCILGIPFHEIHFVVYKMPGLVTFQSKLEAIPGGVRPILALFEHHPQRCML